MFLVGARATRDQQVRSSVPALFAAASKMEEIAKEALGQTQDTAKCSSALDLGSSEVQQRVFAKACQLFCQQRNQEARKYFELLSKLNHSDAMVYLGRISQQEQNYKEAIRHYTDATFKQNPEAMYRLAGIYGYSSGSFSNPQIAEELYREAAALNHVAAIQMIASQYSTSWEESEGWYTKAADLGDRLSMQKIGEHYNKCKQYLKAYEWYGKSADLGNGTACRLVGDLYYNRRLQKDSPTTFPEIDWYLKAVILGDPTARQALQNDLDRALIPRKYVEIVRHVVKTGKMPEEKPPTPSDEGASSAAAAVVADSAPQAAVKAENAAVPVASSASAAAKAQSVAIAVSSPSVPVVAPIDLKKATYQDGVAEYKKGSYGSAFQIFQKWDRLNVSGATIYLGDMYSKGQLVDLSEMMAVDYYKKAAQLGSITAMGRLGGVYENGLGKMKQNLSLAIHWYTRAANARCVFSVERLMAIYEKQKDFAKVVEWAARLYEVKKGSILQSSGGQ